MHVFLKSVTFIYILQKIYLLIERAKRREDTDKANGGEKIHARACKWCDEYFYRLLNIFDVIIYLRIALCYRATFII